MKQKRIYTNTQLYRGKDESCKNRDSLLRSVSCGCFYCETIFFAKDVRDWILEDDGQYTAICPFCNTDAVVGDDAVYPLKKVFLREMREYWYGKNNNSSLT